jgi:hypothetical protein
MQQASGCAQCLSNPTRSKLRWLKYEPPYS